MRLRACSIQICQPRGETHLRASVCGGERDLIVWSLLGKDFYVLSMNSGKMLAKGVITEIMKGRRKDRTYKTTDGFLFRPSLRRSPIKGSVPFAGP